MLKCIFLFFIEWFHIMLTVFQMNIRFDFVLPYMINKNDLHWLLIFIGVDRQWYCLLTRLWYIYYRQYFMCLWLYYATLRNHIKYSVCFSFHADQPFQQVIHLIEQAPREKQTKWPSLLILVLYSIRIRNLPLTSNLNKNHIIFSGFHFR